MYEARSIFVMKNMRVRDLEIFIDYANLDNLVIAFFNWILCHHLINYRCSLFIVINLWSRVKGQSYIITGLKFLDESLPASSATLYSYPQYKTLLTLMNGQQLIPIRFFFRCQWSWSSDNERPTSPYSCGDWPRNWPHFREECVLAACRVLLRVTYQPR